MLLTAQTEKRLGLDKHEKLIFTMQRPEPQNVTPDQIPSPWLADSEWLLEELAKTREQALRIPFRLDNASDIKSLIDRIWGLEQNLRYLLHLHREGQRAFAKKVAAADRRRRKEAKAASGPKIVRISA